jgi:hypothetical protein
MFDRTIDPQGPKMFVCISRENGWFLRINTRDHFKPCVAITLAENPFLTHDSHIECVLLEVDDYEIEESVQHRGVIGTVCDAAKSQVLRHLINSRHVKQRDKPILGEIFANANLT